MCACVCVCSHSYDQLPQVGTHYRKTTQGKNLHAMCKSNEIILDIVTAGSRYHSASHHANVERGRGKVFCVSGMLRVGGGSSLPAGGGE